MIELKNPPHRSEGRETAFQRYKGDQFCQNISLQDQQWREERIKEVQQIPTAPNSAAFGSGGGMLNKYCNGITYVFIDAANILYSQQTLGWRLDYTKPKQYLEKEINLGKIFYYTGKVGSLEKQLSFISKLKRIGFIVVAKEVKFIKINTNKAIPKANLDIELALDAYRFRDEYQTLLLFSGDSDFSYLLKLLKTDLKRIIVCSTKGHIAIELVEEAKFIDLKKLRPFFEYMKTPKPRKAGPGESREKISGGMTI